MWKLLLLSAARFYFRQPWQLGLALLGIALGVAVFTGIQIANSSALRAFELSTSALRGATTYRLLPAKGVIPDSVYEDLVRAGLGPYAAPIVTLPVRIDNAATTHARTDDRRRRADASYELIGIDPIKELRFRRFFPRTGNPADIYLRLLTEPGTMLASADLFDRFGLAEEESVVLRAAGVTASFQVIGEVGTSTESTDAPRVLLADLSTVLDFAGVDGLSRVDLTIDDRRAAALSAELPDGIVLTDAATENSELDAMTSAFTTNLTALGLLALLVGMFLIHATMSYAVLQRRPQLATLRALGVTTRGLVTALIVEAACIGGIAGIAGSILGAALADGLIDLVLRTMSDLAFSRGVAISGTSGWIYVLGCGVGLGTTVVAAALPTLEASRVAPASAERRSHVERQSRLRARKLLLAAAPTLGAAALILLLSRESLVFAFLGLFLVLAAGAMCVPATTIGLMRLAATPARAMAGIAGLMAARSVVASLSRTGVATAALAVAVATVMSIGLMVASFRTSLLDWIDTTLTADIYVSIDGSSTSLDEWLVAIDSHPDIVGTSRSLRATVPVGSALTDVRATSPGPEGWGIDLVAGSQAGWEAALAAGEAVIVSEPYAYRNDIAVGDTLAFAGTTQELRLPVAGIAREYNSAAAPITISLDAYRRFWNDDELSSIGVHVMAGRDVVTVANWLRRSAPADLDVFVRESGAIQRISLLLFDRTFEITSVLRGLAGLIAFFGVLSAILALQLERQREFAVLGSIGMSRSQLRTHVIAQTGLLGLSAGVAAVPLGTVLAWLLVFVINRRSFGWTMGFELSAPPIVYGLGIALAAALLSGLVASLTSMRGFAGAQHAD